jgi:hypothetical protein
MAERRSKSRWPTALARVVSGVGASASQWITPDTVAAAILVAVLALAGFAMVRRHKKLNAENEKMPEPYRPNIHYKWLPLTPEELRTLMRLFKDVGIPGHVVEFEAENLPATVERARLRIEMQGVETEPSGFIGWKLGPTEFRLVVRFVTNLREWDTVESRDREILGVIGDRIHRWAVRQGAYWDDGTEIITAFAAKME